MLGAVISALHSPYGNLHKIKDATKNLAEYSKSLIEDGKPQLSSRGFWDIADSNDQENILGLYLQTEKGYHIIP